MYNVYVRLINTVKYLISILRTFFISSKSIHIHIYLWSIHIILYIIYNIHYITIKIKTDWYFAYIWTWIYKAKECSYYTYYTADFRFAEHQHLSKLSTFLIYRHYSFYIKLKIDISNCIFLLSLILRVISKVYYMLLYIIIYNMEILNWVSCLFLDYWNWIPFKI